MERNFVLPFTGLPSVVLSLLVVPLVGPDRHLPLIDGVAVVAPGDVGLGDVAAEEDGAVGGGQKEFRGGWKIINDSFIECSIRL